jgi:hypothetical protein
VDGSLLVMNLFASSMLHYSTRLIVSGLFIAAMLASIRSIFPCMCVPQRNHEYHCPHSNRASSI